MRLELLFQNERVVVGRKRHPLRHAGSLTALVDAQWLLTGLREREEQEYEELFGTYGLPAPKMRMRIDSTMGLLSMVWSTDMLVLLPRQWTDAPMFKGVLEEIKVKETLLAPDIVLVARAGVPLTPLAERLAVLLQRASGKPYDQDAS